MTTFPPISQLLPHDDPMVLLDRLVDWSAQGATCLMTVRPNTRFVEGDRLSTYCLLEHMAQSIAACLGYEAYRGGEGPRVGMIIACRELVTHVDTVQVADALRLQAERESGSDTLSRFRCRVTRGEQAIAEATMTLFHAAGLR